MRIFISSVISEFEEYRAAAREAIESLGHHAQGAEDFPAKVGSPQQACLSAVRESDVVLLVLGSRYGGKLSSGLSATHEEYNEAAGRKPILLFVQSGVEMDLDQENFLRQAQDWSAGLHRAAFSTATDLRSQVVRALHNHELATATGPIDESDLLQRAQAMFPTQRGQGASPQLQFAIAGGPRQQIIRPADLENRSWSRVIQREAMFGDFAVLDSGARTDLHVNASTLVIEQEGRAVAIDETGSLLVASPAYDRDERRMSGLAAVIEEDLTESLRRTVLFCAWLLSEIDSSHRLTTVVPVARMANANYLAWRTRDEHRANPNSMTISANQGSSVAVLSPPSRHRQALSHNTDTIVEDMIVLLRRGMR